MVVAPASPAFGVEEAEIVDDQERSRLRADHGVERRLDRLEPLVQLVPAQAKTSLLQRLDFGAAVVLRYEDIVSLAETECLNAVPERVARPGIERAAVVSEREGKPLGPAA